MKEKDLRFINSWQKHQERGKAIYLTGYALLYTLITIAISVLLRNGDESMISLLQSTDFLGKALLFAAIGLILAHFRWKTNNAKYKALKQSIK